MHSFKTNLPDRFSIDKIQISKVHKYSTMETIEAAINKKIFGYICVTNSRTVYLANNDPNYCKIQNNSLLTVPDGMPGLDFGQREIDFLKQKKIRLSFSAERRNFRIQNNPLSIPRFSFSFGSEAFIKTKLFGGKY